VVVIKEYSGSLILARAIRYGLETFLKGGRSVPCPAPIHGHIMATGLHVDHIHSDARPVQYAGKHRPGEELSVQRTAAPTMR
jgi:hypothetical protein